MTFFYWFVWRLVRSIFKIIFRLKIIDEKLVPTEGSFIIACNHCAYADPPLASISIKRPIHFMAKQELFKVPLLGRIIIALNSHPVTRRGYDRKAIRTALEILEKGEPVIIFPEGTRGNGEEFLPAQPGIGLIAKKSGAPILPVYISGSNKLGPCFWGRDKLAVIFGEIFSPEKYKDKFENNREGYQKISDETMSRIGRLKKESEIRIEKA